MSALIEYKLKSDFPLPDVRETYSFAKHIRKILMGHSQRVSGNATPFFTGKNPDGSLTRNHGHIYISPRDMDGDGRIDTVHMSWCGEVLPGDLDAIRGLESMPPNGIQYILNDTAPRNKTSSLIASITPYLRHRTTYSRYRNNGPMTDVEWLQAEVMHTLAKAGHKVLSIVPRDIAPNGVQYSEFERSRGNDRRPYIYAGFDVLLSSPASVPFCIGSMGHYGYGLFDLVS